MRSFVVVSTSAVLFVLSIGLSGQTLKHRPEKSETPAPAQSKPSIALQVAPGTPLKIALDKEVRIRRVGQPIGGTTTEPIYSFDKLLVPVGSRVTGKITEIDNVSKSMRTLSAMNADFSPERKIGVEFDQLTMPDGRRVPIQTVVSPVAGVLQFVPAKQTRQTKLGTGKAKEEAKGKLNEARQAVKQQIADMKKQISEPGKMHRLERFALTQS